ncbi:Hypothetical predicted protein [Pelobates cultripes]|uniref:Uncharacterized protein n=1 Tax=Pelobates cultripes TaxID=61616 RepID=A0AAD1T5L0_PELCU|nr:Hypothetical predicted protein [Pelobates cultripes]
MRCLGSAVKKYLVDNNLPLKTMYSLRVLIIQASRKTCWRTLISSMSCSFRLTPPHYSSQWTSRSSPILKELYTRELFQRCFEMTDRSSLILHEFLREHFDIVSCLQIITIAGVSQTNLNSAWRNLWPDCVVKPASSASAPAPESTVLEEIVSLGRTMGLEVTEEDVYELVEEHDRDLTTEELVELQEAATEEQTAFEEEEEMSEEQLSSTELKEACQMWVNLQTLYSSTTQIRL